MFGELESSVSEIHVVVNNSCLSKKMRQQFFKIDKNFVQTISFECFSEDWCKSRECDYNLKVLKIEKCPSLSAALDQCKTLDIRPIPSLFVLVFEFEEELKTPTNLRQFGKIFKANILRPIILQFNSSNGQCETVLIKGYMELDFNYLSSIENSAFPFTRVFKEMLEVYGNFDGDIMTAEMSCIQRDSNKSQDIAASVLCLRVANLFAGGVARVMPWLNLKWVLRSNCNKAVLAFIDYPFARSKAVELALQSERLALLEMLIALDFPFPKNFDSSKDSESFKKILNQRRDLHQSIAEQDALKVSKILDEIERSGRVKYGYNQENECAMMTALRNFNFDVYALLLRRKILFTSECSQLLSELTESVKEMISHINLQSCTQLQRQASDHPIISKCWLAFDHSNDNFNLERIKRIFTAMEKLPEINELLKLAVMYRDLRIVFDVKNSKAIFMRPTCKQSFSGARGSNGVIYISAVRNSEKVQGAIAHELTHYVVRMIYRNHNKPYHIFDLVRKQEFDKIIEMCQKLSESNDSSSIPVFNNAFRYPPTKIASELIARVPEVLASYSTDDIEAAKRKYPELFAYYYDNVEKHIKVTLSQFMVMHWYGSLISQTFRESESSE